MSYTVDNDSPIEYIPTTVAEEYYAFTPALADAYCFTCHSRHTVLRIPGPPRVAGPYGYHHGYRYVISATHHESYYAPRTPYEDTMRIYTRYSRA